MHPVLLEFGIGGTRLALRSYGVFYTLAWLAAPALAAWTASRSGAPWRRALFVYALALAAGIVGARALDLFVAWRYYAEDPGRIWSPSFAGFSLYGGLAVAAVTGVALARALGLDPWRLADAAVPGLALGIVLMRVGCFLNGCCFGIETDAPWGVTFPAGSPAWRHQLLTGSGGLFGTLAGSVRPVHPTQLYEIGAALLLMAGAFALARRAPGGVRFLIFATGFTAARWAIYPLRARVSVITAPEWFYPALYAGLIAVLAVLAAVRLRSAARRQVPRARTPGPSA